MKGNYFTKLLTLFALLWAGNMYANNIQVTINSYDATLKRLNVTLSWDNSWHDGTGTFRDAAWVFVKYKDATMSTWATAPVANTSLTSITSTGNNVRFEAIGKNPITETVGATDFRGLIIRRAKPSGVAATDPTIMGVYNVSMTFNIPFVFTGTPANPEFKIFALEMVDVPQGAFWAGDGSGISRIRTSSTNPAPVNVSSATTVIPFTETPIFLSPLNSTPISSNFPKGYNEYYIMKYELSQEGFVEFLNTLTRTEQNSVINQPGFTAASFTTAATLMSSGNVYFETGTISGYGLDGSGGAMVRQGVKAVVNGVNDPAIFSCDLNNNSVFNEANDGQNIPAIPGYVSAIYYYLNWAGLAPMTELEFEKACRGPVYPVQGEYSWGTAQKQVPTGTLVDNGGSNESYSSDFQGPTFNLPTAVYQSTFLFNYDILRCGSFAKSSGSTRLTSGGSYYGVMDLSNNAFEMALPINSTATSFSLGSGTATLNSTWSNLVINKSLRGGVSPTLGTVSQSASPVIDVNAAINSLLGIRGVIR